jgi:hypothetical protein
MQLTQQIDPGDLHSLKGLTGKEYDKRYLLAEMMITRIAREVQLRAA